MFALLDSSPAIPIATALAALVLGAWLSRAWARWRARRRMRRLRRMGARGEARAQHLLRSHGYTVVRWQVTAHAEVIVDGARRRFPVRADAIVDRGGRTFVAEVKGGLQAANIAHRATRRQLLEYAASFELDGVVLVDAARDQVHTIEFPALMDQA